MSNIIQEIDHFPRNINVKELSKGLEIFQTLGKTEIKQVEKNFLQKLIVQSKISEGISVQILKSWVAFNVRRNSEFNLDFTDDYTQELVEFYHGKRLQYLENFVDLVVDSETELVKEFIENGLLENLLKDFKNGIRVSIMEYRVEEDRKRAEYLVQELVLIVKVLIAFLYDTSLFVDTTKVFMDLVGMQLASICS
jgi:hypothetical protein